MTSIALGEALGIILAKSVPELLGNLIPIKLDCCIPLAQVSWVGVPNIEQILFKTSFSFCP